MDATERGVRTDLLNPAAVRAFLDIVYEQYARRFPQHLGSTIRFFVSDHEGAYGAPLPYTPALWETFRQRHNYDLRPLLPLLSSDSERAVKARQDYLETVSHLYAANYVQQVTDWCSRHNVAARPLRHRRDAAAAGALDRRHVPALAGVQRHLHRRPDRACPHADRLSGSPLGGAFREPRR